MAGYLMWDDDHNGSADVGSTIQYFGSNGFHYPWRSTAWEIHPVMKIEVIGLSESGFPPRDWLLYHFVIAEWRANAAESHRAKYWEMIARQDVR